MGEYMSDNYIARDLNGTVICEGSADRVSNILRITRIGLIDACNEKRIIKGKYMVSSTDKEDITPSKLRDHLFREDGGRAYEYKKGYPNRYKDASCVRFTPL